MATLASVKTPSLLAALLLVVALSGCEGAQENTDAAVDSHLMRSKAYQEQGQIRAAIIEAKNIIKKAPQNTLGYEQLAKLHLEAGNSKGAITILEPMAIESAPARIHLSLAQAYSLQGKHRSAKSSLENYSAGGGDSTLESRLLNGRTLAGRGLTEEAIAEFQSITSQYPDSVEAQILTANIHISQKEFAKAKGLLEKALKQDPENAEALLIVAKLAYLKNDLETAEKHLTDALLTLPDTDVLLPMRAQVLRQLSRVVTEQGRSSEALIYSRLLTSKSPVSHEAQSKLSNAMALLQSGEIDKAEEILTELNESFPQNDTSALYLGLINYQKGDFEGADILLSEHMDPEIATPKLVETSALAKLRLNKVEEATNMLDEALQSHPNNEHLLILYGLSALSQKNIEEKGRMALEKALAINPRLLKVRTALARYYIRNNKRELGIAHLNQAVKDAPNDATTVSNYAQAMLLDNNPAKAKEAIDQLLQNSPKSVAAINLSAQFAVATQKPEQARKQYLKALSIDPNNIAATNAMAALAIKQSDTDTAIKYYRKLIDLAPAEPQGYKGLVTAYELAKKSPEGLTALKQYVVRQQEKTSTPAFIVAQYYVRRSNLDDAKMYFNKGIERDKDSALALQTGASVFFSEASLAFNRRDYEAARKATIAAIEYAPTSTRLLALLTETEIHAGRIDEAKKVIEEIRDNYPAISLPQLLTGKVYLQQEDLEAAIKSFQEGWTKQPTEMLGKALYASLNTANNASEAANFLNDWRNTIPNSNQARIYRALELQKSGDFNQAISLYEEAIAGGGETPPVLNNLAWLYFTNKDPRAMDTAKKAFNMAPNSYAIADTYGWILYNAGQFKEAVELLQTADKLAPDNQEIREHLAAAKAAL